MARIETGGAAFPRPASIDTRDGTLPDGDRVIGAEDGMTLRDYFAAKAMQGFVGDRDVQVYGIHGSGKSDDYCQQAAVAAYRVADAMLAARKANATVQHRMPVEA
jgi:hypothetical protein